MYSIYIRLRNSRFVTSIQHQKSQMRSQMAFYKIVIVTFYSNRNIPRITVSNKQGTAK